LSGANQPATAAVLISGSGSNLQSLIDAIHNGDTALLTTLVISNKAQAKGLQRARKAGIPALCLENRNFDDRRKFDRALARIIDAHRPDMLILAGFMHILSPEFVSRYRGRILNIHPSLLPAYPGLNTHQRVIDNKETWHGCTVHFVTPALDAGPPVIAGRLPVAGNDTAASLAARVLKIEHRIYPIAANLLALGRIRCENDRVFLDNEPLPEPIIYRNGTIKP